MSHFRRALRWYRGLPRWQRWALALPAILVGVLALVAGVARLARRPARPGVSRAVGEALQRRSDETRAEADRVRAEADVAPERHAAEDAAVADEVADAGARARAEHERDRDRWWRDRGLP